MAGIQIDIPNFDKIMAGIEGDIAAASTKAMKDTTVALKTKLRAQVTGAGMSQRLANSWQGTAYPQQGKSLTPTGYVRSNAPDIIDAFARGATIRPVNGAKYVWIPQAAVPRARRRLDRRGRVLSGDRMSPEEVEALFNAEFVIARGRGSSLLAYIETIKGRNNKVERRATPGRRAQGRAAKLTLMFVLRRSVKMPKLFDLEGAADDAADDYLARLSANLG